jgi:hypothetical protein
MMPVKWSMGHGVAWMIFTALVMVRGPSFAAPADLPRTAAKTKTLTDAMDHIDDMREKISDKLARARRIHAFVLSRRSDFAGEIQQRMAELNILSFGRAVQDERIRYNLQLTAMLQGCSETLSRRIAYFQLGDDQLGYFCAQAGDDLKMIQAVSGLSVARLVREVTQTIDAYRPAVDAPLIDIRQIATIPPEVIWQALPLPPPVE